MLVDQLSSRAQGSSSSPPLRTLFDELTAKLGGLEASVGDLRRERDHYREKFEEKSEECQELQLEVESLKNKEERLAGFSSIQLLNNLDHLCLSDAHERSECQSLVHECTTSPMVKKRSESQLIGSALEDRRAFFSQPQLLEPKFSFNEVRLGHPSLHAERVSFFSESSLPIAPQCDRTLSKMDTFSNLHYIPLVQGDSRTQRQSKTQSRRKEEGPCPNDQSKLEGF
mmetsp:Transcript_15978/g.26956  ORF Transcript_15978/g.26956 Transcript_15978/m.26956 type:complete len:227 (+) Transcript_15978:313-993(+)